MPTGIAQAICQTPAHAADMPYPAENTETCGR
jgi:hypothetical protein